MPRQKGAAAKSQQQCSIPTSSQSTLHDAEIAYIHSKHAVDEVCAHEESRRLRLKSQIIACEAEDTRLKLSEVQHSAKRAQEDIVNLQRRCDDALGNAEKLKAEIQARTNECQSLRVSNVGSMVIVSAAADQNAD